MLWTQTTGRFTVPQGAMRMALFLQILDRFPTGRLLDLGTGHGLFARLAADCGWTVTAVDARDTRFPDDDRVTWLKQDVRECSTQGYDVISALGLWYHLTLEDQLALAARCDGTPLMIDTHIALTPHRAHKEYRKVLSRLQTYDGYSGRLYGEAKFQDRFTASFGNNTSFWPTERSLRRELRKNGYDLVETFDPPVAVDRRFFLATRIQPDRGAQMDALIGRYIRPKTAEELEQEKQPG